MRLRRVFPAVYSWFAVFEYLIVITNIVGHYAATWDQTGVALALVVDPSASLEDATRFAAVPNSMDSARGKQLE